MSKRKIQIKYVTMICLLFSQLGLSATKSELTEKITRSAEVLNEISSVSDNAIPQSLLEKSVCIATFPDVLRGGFVFGAKYGRGVVSCRTDNGWSRPSFVQIFGGSWGLQIGAASVDMVLVFVNKNASDRLSENNFTLGGDASIAIGPLGRDAQAGTDYQFSSEVYSYSRTRGFFGGLTIEGSSLTVDEDSNRIIYQTDISAKDLLISSGASSSRPMTTYIHSLNLNAP